MRHHSRLDEEQVVAGCRRVVRSLFIAGALLAPAFAHLSAQSSTRESGRFVVRGRVVDSVNAPIIGAEVTVIGGNARRSSLTDSTGTFSMRTDLREFELRARRIGYYEFAKAVDASDAAVRPFQVVLHNMVRELDELEVNAKSPDAAELKLAEFYEHRRVSKFGYFFDQKQIEKTNVRRIAELLRNVPGTRLLPSPQWGSVVRIRGCRPLLWIDGQRVPGAELDEVLNVHDIAGLEVYNSFAGIPPQFIDRDTNCGAVVIWTKVR